MNYTELKLIQLLSHASQNIKRHAFGILKELQKEKYFNRVKTTPQEVVDEYNRRNKD